jgi:recombination protein RecA
MATAAQSYSSLLRQKIEETLAARGGARLTLAPRLVCEGHDTGFATLDAVLRGGLPVAGTTEIVGGRSSGRATIAAAYLAERTREGHVCAWVDVAGDLAPEACLADGVDLERVLWVRCGGAEKREDADASAALRNDKGKWGRTDECTLRRNDKGGEESGLRVVSYGRDKSIGTPGVPNRPLIQVSEDRLPKRRGQVVLQSRAAILPSRYEAAEDRPRTGLKAVVASQPVPAKRPFVKAKRPWTRLEQAVKAVDLLVQAGGFGAIVLDMGGIGAEFARRIPLATWFRWRAALERTRTSLVVLSPLAGAGAQLGCAGSSAELVLRVAAELPEPGTVMRGVSYRLEVVRRRFENVDSGGKKKPPQRATAWESRAWWVAS